MSKDCIYVLSKVDFSCLCFDCQFVGAVLEEESLKPKSTEALARGVQ